MHDRVVDRAAKHATPAHLAIRDWLLVALSFSTGVYEAICFLSFGKVFTAFQTGNIVFLGVGLAGTRPPAGPNWITVVISLAAFAAGAALAMPILKAVGAETDLRGNAVFQVWPRRVSIVLGISLLLAIAFFAVWQTTSAPIQLAYTLIALSAFAMGAQMNAIRSLHVPGMSTTAFTATFISLVNGIKTWSLTGAAVRRLAGSLIGLAAGALLGDSMLRYAHAYAPLVPVVVIALVIAIASVALKPVLGAAVPGAPGEAALPGGPATGDLQDAGPVPAVRHTPEGAQ
ncbi:MAG TPA: YoaK family protein [Streptosporangiaceae bacterium]